MIFISFIFSLVSFLITDRNEYFELKSFNSDYYFYNIVQINDQLYFGTSKGVLTYNDEKVLVLFTKDITGPIEQVNGKLIEGEVRYDNYFNYLLPNNYNSLSSSILLNNQSLFIVNKGDLFHFGLKMLEFYVFPSIRAISENYVGTYQGIYDRRNGEILKFPTFTNGYIREFDEISMILWDGLSIIENGVQKNYFDSNGAGILFGDQFLGLGRDVVEIKHPKYLISSTKGLYEINLDTEEVDLLKEAHSNSYSIIRTEYNAFGTERVFFHDDVNIYQYNFITREESLLLSSDDSIIDVFSDSASVYYILTKQNLLFKHLNLPRKNQVLISNPSAHTLGKYDNILYLTSNEGLSIYHLNESKYKPNIVKNEFNRLAHNINNGILELGSISGLYSFTKTGLEELFDNYIEINPEKDFSSFQIITIFLFLIFMVVWTIVWQRNLIEKKLSTTDDLTFKDRVSDFIKADLAHASVYSLCKHFNISTVELYKRLGETRPGQIIRKERMKEVRKMRKINANEKDIAAATGFSLGYLKKI